MKGNIRSFFPGGNTAKGFFSYYPYILDQREASHIVCIKGGPGVGKSNFMKNIAEHFLEKGEDIDFFWCSSDPDSLDGIVLCDRKIAFLDGTSPHMIDPITPGAVDTIIHLGDFWNGAALKKYKAYIMNSNEKIRNWFQYAYYNLKAAAELRITIKDVYQNSLLPGEMYMKAASIVNKELSHKKITLAEGKCKKYFATAITPKGHVNHMKSLIKDYNKLYLFTAPVGFDASGIMKVISENAVHRGYFVEQYYCPMEPDTKIEHLLIPELELGFVTLNNYHDLELWECGAETTVVETREFIDWNDTEIYSELITACENNSNILIGQAIDCLKKAKQEHDVLEGYYVPNMNFEKIDNLRDEWIAKIEQNKV